MWTLGDWKDADGDKRSRKLPAVEITWEARQVRCRSTDCVGPPRGSSADVGVAAEPFDLSVALRKLLGTHKTNPKRTKNLKGSSREQKKGAQQEQGGDFARFDLVLYLARIGMPRRPVELSDSGKKS